MRQVLRSGIVGISGLILPFVAACLGLGLAACGGGGGGAVPAPVATSVTLSSIAITPVSATVAKGATASLTATGTYSNGTTANITAQVTWTSAAPATASVGASTGVVTGAAVGSTTVTAALSGVTSPTASITVTNASLSSIAITPVTASIAKGKTATFTATGTYSDGTTGNISGSVTWWASNSAVTINASGIATGVNIGSSSISATLGGKTSNTATLTIAAPTLTAIAITPASVSVSKGTTASLTATATYSDGSTGNVTATATWSSASTSVATVGLNTGVVTGIAVGTTTVTAALSGVTSSAATITVAHDFYVNASTGMNPLSCSAYPMPTYSSYYPTWGDGTAAHPFKTITCALAAAKAKVTGTSVAVSVKAMPGLYNVASGETFPLTLSTKVSLVGDTANKGAPAGGTATEISGNAVSPALAGGVGIGVKRNCTIFAPPAAANAAIGGFKITGGDATLQSNFAADAAAGLTIADNQFSSATVGIVGMELFNGASATIARNVITTHFGVDAEDFTTSATLRGNTLNGTYAVVTAIWGAGNVNSIIDLGTSASPGNNIIQSLTAGFYVLGLGAGGPTTYNAVGNTWKANTQFADANGHYPGTLAANPVVGAAAGANFNIPAGVSIQF